MLIVSEKLKELRQEKGLSQEEVAAQLKVSRVVYNRYEKDKRTIPLEYIKILADFYDVSMDYIFGREK